jgi:hypothetical protein
LVLIIDIKNKKIFLNPKSFSIMKKITLIISMITLCVGFSSSALAQVTASAPTTATIVAPIAIAKNIDMNFGNVAVSTASGTVLMTPVSGTPTRTPSGGVTLPASATVTPTAAKFTVTGEGTYTYAITLPSTDFTLTLGVTTNTMIVNAFTSTPSTTGALTAGTQDLYVGATLNVGASQVAGLYQNVAGFPVTVNYN